MKELEINGSCKIFQANFMKLREYGFIIYDSNLYDAAYAIEATCHAPDRTKCFKEIHNILRPGGYFASYEWILTDKFDEKDKNHNKIKFGIESGNSLPNLTTKKDVLDSLKNAGFEIVDEFDAN